MLRADARIVQATAAALASALSLYALALIAAGMSDQQYAWPGTAVVVVAAALLWRYALRAHRRAVQAATAVCACGYVVLMLGLLWSGVAARSEKRLLAFAGTAGVSAVSWQTTRPRRGLR